jgi:hypothetical protein
MLFQQSITIVSVTWSIVIITHSAISVKRTMLSRDNDRGIGSEKSLSATLESSCFHIAYE